MWDLASPYHESRQTERHLFKGKLGFFLDFDLPRTGFGDRGSAELPGLGRGLSQPAGQDDLHRLAVAVDIGQVDGFFQGQFGAGRIEFPGFAVPADQQDGCAAAQKIGPDLRMKMEADRVAMGSTDPAGVKMSMPSRTVPSPASRRSRACITPNSLT